MDYQKLGRGVAMSDNYTGACTGKSPTDWMRLDSARVVTHRIEWVRPKVLPVIFTSMSIDVDGGLWHIGVHVTDVKLVSKVVLNFFGYAVPRHQYSQIRDQSAAVI